MKKNQWYIGTKSTGIVRTSKPVFLLFMLQHFEIVQQICNICIYSTNSQCMVICNKDNTTCNIIKSKYTEDKRMPGLSGNAARSSR